MRLKLLPVTVVLLLLVTFSSACTLSLTGSAPTPFADSTKAVMTALAMITKPVSTEAVSTTSSSIGKQTEANQSAPAVTATTGLASPQAAPPTLTVAPTQAPAPTNTPQPTAPPTKTSTPTRSPVPTATFAPGDIRAGLGAPTWRDTFDDPQTWSNDYEDERVILKRQDGKFFMTAKTDKYVVGWALTPVETAQKFYIEMDVTTHTCAKLDRYGIMLSPTTRANKGYMFNFFCDGHYSLWTWDGVDEEVNQLLAWVPSKLIKAGSNQTNRIGIKVVNDHFYLYANGSLLFDLVDDSMEKDYFGVFIGAQVTPGFTAEVGELDYWELP